MKIISVLGTTRSGSNAIFDYLATRPDAFSPLGQREYLLPQIPYGLMQFRSACGEAFHYTIAHEAMERFLDVSLKLARKPVTGRFGGDYEKLIPGFSKQILNFVDSLSISEMPIRFIWEKIGRDPKMQFLEPLRHILSLYKSTNHLASKKWLPADRKSFDQKAREMHLRLFAPPDVKTLQFTVLNQAGSGWNPINSTNFFPGRKVLLVTRDPRDQFSELKIYKGSRDVTQFCNWYRALQHRITFKHKDIFRIRFENFVYKYDQTLDEILAFLALEPNYTLYDPQRSAINVGKFKKLLDHTEIEQIESQLGKEFPDEFY